MLVCVMRALVLVSFCLVSFEDGPLFDALLSPIDLMYLSLLLLAFLNDSNCFGLFLLSIAVSAVDIYGAVPMDSVDQIVCVGELSSCGDGLLSNIDFCWFCHKLSAVLDHLISAWLAVCWIDQLVASSYIDRRLILLFNG